MMKYLKVIIPLTIVIIAILWIFYPELNWEPYTVMFGTVLALITGISFFKRNRSIIGSWHCQTVGDDGSVVDVVHIYGKSNELRFVSKIRNIPFGNRDNHINIVCKGSYQFKEDRLMHNYERHSIASSSGLPDMIIKMAVEGIYQHADEDFVSISNDCLKLKSGNGVTRSFNKTNDNSFKNIVDQFIV